MNFVELIGYIGSFFVLVSFLMTSVVKLRVINIIGGVIFGTYSLMIQSYPTFIMQVCLIMINLYSLYQLNKDSKQYELVEVTKDDAFMQYIMHHYESDIQSFYTDIEKDWTLSDISYVICHKTVPAGIFLGKRNGYDIDIVCDYTAPAYRDCSVGKYLYDKIEKTGVKKLRFPKNAKNYDTYLQKMGFKLEDGIYVYTTK